MREKESERHTQRKRRETEKKTKRSKFSALLRLCRAPFLLFRSISIVWSQMVAYTQTHTHASYTHVHTQESLWCSALSSSVPRPLTIHHCRSSRTFPVLRADSVKTHSPTRTSFASAIFTARQTWPLCCTYPRRSHFQQLPFHLNQTTAPMR